MFIFKIQLEMEKCCLCNEWCADNQLTVLLRKKGSDSINYASVERGKSLVTQAGDRVHVSCRLDYIKPRNIARDKSSQQQEPVMRSLRSKQIFNFQVHCLFCGHFADVENRKRLASDLETFPVRSGDFQQKIIDAGKIRNDNWSKAVLGRIASVNDLHAADAIYHKQCNTNFRNNKNIPSQVHLDSDNNPKRLKAGRPEIDEKASAFLQVIQYLEEHGDEQKTIGDLVMKMEEVLKGTGYEPYSSKWMKMKIKEHFGQRVFMTVLSTKKCIVTLTETASSILFNYHKERPQSIEDEKIQIIKTAAKLIVSEVKSMKPQNDMYPDASDISNSYSYLPILLQELLVSLFGGKENITKISSIGQCLIQAIRPRAQIAPLQIGLALQFHHHFGSRFAVDTLHEYGFSCSYSEVMKYKRSAAVAQGTEIPGLSDMHHMEFIADNVDHNIVTLDGKGTFHGMGIIAAITPGIQFSKPVPKVEVTAAEISAIGGINIIYTKINAPKEPLVYQSLSRSTAENPTSPLDLLWKSSLLLRIPRPAWSGMMQFLHDGQHPGKSSVTFLPMIDLDPSDISCIYSTLKFVADHAQRHKVPVIVTFDQPLYWKALNIIHSPQHSHELEHLVLRLGAFHMQMSFLGSIGHIMEGSGLEDLLELVYAKNTVSHMMSGKAISRAWRGHLLADAALNTLLMADVYNVPLPSKENVDAPLHTAGNELPENEETPTHEEEPETATSDLTEAAKLYDRVMSSESSVDEVCASEVLKIIKDKKSLMKTRTAQLWLRYMKMLDIVRNFIKAERTGNWELHLQSVYDMIPYFAATGHRLYAKSAHVYLQNMLSLPVTHPEVHKKFKESFHVIRRSNRYWAGIPTDLTIEQVLMM